MIMKRIYLYIAVLLAGSLFTGCNKYLNVLPESEYSVSGSYKTENDFQQAIAGVYAQQQSLYQSNACYYRAMICRGDEAQIGGQYLEGLDQFIDNENNTVLDGAWNNYWRIIYLSNMILSKIDAGTFNDPAMQSYIKGEAYMFRAYGYWNLGWQFGGVPLIDKPTGVAETKTEARSTQEATFDKAIADYTEAMGLLPEAWTGSNAGRVTKYAAEGMLARLYLFQSQFGKAKPLLNDIITSGKYKMEDNYLDCFTDSHDNGPERVWEVQFTGGLTGEGQFFSTGLLPEGFNDPSIMPFSGFSTAVIVSDELYYSYEQDDKRKAVSILKGWNNRGVEDTVSAFILKYSHYDAYTPKTQQDWANNLPVLRYTDVLMMYAEVLNEESYVANGQAFTIINDVRKRAGLGALTATTVADQGAFREALRRERRHEFAFEGLRWRDMIRWGIAENVMNSYFQGEKEGNGRYSMKAYQTLFAIPFEAISRYNDDAVMWQNPGY